MKTISEFAPEKSGTKWLTLRAVSISLVSGRTGPAGSGRPWNAPAELPGTRVLFGVRVGREDWSKQWNCRPHVWFSLPVQWRGVPRPTL